MLLDMDSLYIYKDDPTRNFQSIQKYLNSLVDGINLCLSGLEVGNFNDADLLDIKRSAVADLEGNMSLLTQTAESIEARVSDAEGNISELSLTASGLTSRVSDTEGDISTLTLTANSLTTRIADTEGDISSLTQTADSIDLRVTATEVGLSTAQGNIASLTLTASNLTTRITDAEGDISQVEQTAGKISWIVASGTSSSNFTLTNRAMQLVAQYINITGYVTFSALSSAGQTNINGDNITTGTISAERIDVSSLTVDTVWMGGTKVLYGSYGAVYIGGQSYSGAASDIYIRSLSEITFSNSWSSIGLKIDFIGKWFGPYSVSIYDGYTLGESTSRYWLALYVEDIHVVGDIIPTNGVSALGGIANWFDVCYVEEIHIGGNSSYNILANSLRELRPSSSSSSYPCYLGTNSYPWHYAYLGSVECRIGSSAYSELGFFGASPIARRSLSAASGTTVSDCITHINNIITGLKAYGLFT